MSQLSIGPTTTCVTEVANRVWHRGNWILSVQAGERLLLVQLDTLCSPDLAARGDGNRPLRYQDEVGHAQSVGLKYRRCDIAFHDAQPFRRFFVGLILLLEFDDGDQLLSTIPRNRNRRAASARYLLD